MTAQALTEAEIEACASELAESRSGRIEDLFAAAGATPPEILWRPRLEQIEHPVLAAFHRSADAACVGGVVPVEFLESEAFAALAEWAMVMEVAESGSDFTYTHYGAEITRAFGNDLTGRRTSEIGGHISPFFIALYRAVLARRDWVRSVHEPPRAVFARRWRRLIVPLFDEQGTICRLAAVNVAENELRAGLEAVPDAVLVVSAEGRICLANRAALRFFGRQDGGGTGLRLTEFTGLSLRLSDPPEDVVRAGGRQLRETMMVGDALLVEVDLTIGATFYRDEAYYVITARQTRG